MPGFHPISHRITVPVKQSSKKTVDKLVEVIFREYDKEDFPLSCTVFRSDPQLYQLPTTEFRVLSTKNGPRLFAPATISENNKTRTALLSMDTDAICKRFLHPNERDIKTESQIADAVKELQETYICYDGCFWQPATEPVYTCNIQKEHITIDIERFDMVSNCSASHLYRADELALLEDDVRKSYSILSSYIIPYKLEWLKKNYIQIENNFLTAMEPRENRIFNAFSKDVEDVIFSMFSAALGNSEEGLHAFPGLEKIYNRVVADLWKNSNRQVFHSRDWNKKIQTEFLRALEELSY